MATSPHPNNTLSVLAVTQKVLNDLGSDVRGINTNKLSTDIRTLARVTRKANNENNKLLLEQDRVKKLINAENERIQTNMRTIENNLLTKKRSVEFNENRRLYTQHYNQMLFTATVGLGLMVAIAIVSRQLSFIPSFVQIGLIVLIGAAAAIKIFMLYTTIRGRVITNYNELKLDKPVMSLPENGKEAGAAAAGAAGGVAGAAGSADPNSSTCIGPACCDTANNILWNESSRKCTYQAPFGNMFAFNAERLRYNESTLSPNSPSEVNMYSKV